MQFVGLPARAGIAPPDVPLASCIAAGAALDLPPSPAAVLHVGISFYPTVQVCMLRRACGISEVLFDWKTVLRLLKKSGSLRGVWSAVEERREGNALYSRKA